VPQLSGEGAEVTTYNIEVNAKAATAPAATRFCGLKLYWRKMPMGAAPSAWASIVLNNTSVGANLFPTLFEQTLAIGGGVGELDVNPGDIVYFELTRIDPSAGTELVGDLNVLRIADYWSGWV
jgi:hypothetical protein